jgi:hypothetical protein
MQTGLMIDVEEGEEGRVENREILCAAMTGIINGQFSDRDKAQLPQCQNHLDHRSAR